MSSIPYAMTVVTTKKKKMGIESQCRQNEKLLTGIWGKYESFASSQNRGTIDSPAPPIFQVMQEHEDQMERVVSPVIEMLKDKSRRSRSIQRSRSLSLADIFLHQNKRERSASPFLDYICSHRNAERRSSSPLICLAKEHLESLRSVSPLIGSDHEEFEPIVESNISPAIGPAITVQDVQLYDPM